MSESFLEKERRRIETALNPTANVCNRIAAETPTFDEFQKIIKENLDLPLKGQRSFPNIDFNLERLQDSHGSGFKLDGTSKSHNEYSRAVMAITDQLGNIVTIGEQRVVVLSNPRYFISSQLLFDGSLRLQIFSPTFWIVFDHGLATFHGHNDEKLEGNQITEKMKSMFQMAMSSKYLTEQAGFEDSVF